MVVCLPSHPTFISSLPQFYSVNRAGFKLIEKTLNLNSKSCMVSTVSCVKFCNPKGEWTDKPSQQLCLGIWIFGLWVVVT